MSLLLVLSLPVLAVPRDIYGRPVADELGPISYRREGSAWILRDTDGFRPATGPASPTAPSPPPTPPAEAFTLSAYATIDVGSWPEAVAIGDVTGDGLADVVMTTTYYFDEDNDYHVFVFAQGDDGELESPASYPFEGTGSRTGLVLTDLDEDGLLDVVVGHSSGVSVLLADGTGGLEEAEVTEDDDADTLAATDVDLDGHIDLISLGWTRGASIFYGDGAGGFFEIEALETEADGYNDHELEDLSGDGYPDLAVMSGQSFTNLSVHLHDGDGALASTPDSYDVGGSELTNGIGLGDVNGDGLHDAVLSGWGNSPVDLYIFLQDDDGGLDDAVALSTYDIPEPVEVSDIDDNGYEDIVVAHGGWTTLTVYLQDDDGLDAGTRYTLPYASHYAEQGLALGDFSDDGCGDIAIGDYNHGLVVLYGDCYVDEEEDGSEPDDPSDDADGEDVPDDVDLCPDLAETAEVDTDGDGLGDACDSCPLDADVGVDTDGDGIDDVCDVCPNAPDPEQWDSDGDGPGDVCDVCPYVADDGSDADGDGQGDACDVCPDLADDGSDTDGDGFGDACDDCPELADASQLDSDRDGPGDVCDVCPYVADDGSDADGDGQGDACDSCPQLFDDNSDRDADGVGDACDNCVAAPNPDQADADGDGSGDACDIESGAGEAAALDSICGCASAPSGGGWMLPLGLMMMVRRRRS